MSESSVKRWVDSGRLSAAKTVGGHRKVPLTSVAAFLRETGHELAEPSILGMVAVSRGASLEEARNELFDGLLAGAEAAVRELILGFYQRGESIAAIGDQLIAPVFCRIGADWASGAIQVHQERRCCEVMMATLHELRRWLPPAADSAPKALVATPHPDFAEVPLRLVELVLIASGWRVTMAGSALPLCEIRAAVIAAEPSLVCLSATHLEDTAAFVRECNEALIRPLRTTPPGETVPKFVAGGGALDDESRDGLEVDAFARSLADLVSYQALLAAEAA